MIKIDKSISTVPTSLIPAYPILFPNQPRIPQTSSTTHLRRMEIIAAGTYIDKGIYNDRYKSPDIRKALVEIYHNKCAYCEQKVEQYHVEHYRPKKIYYWLAYSWDNLIMACPKCNGRKGVHFKILGTKAHFSNTAANLRRINSSSAGYDALEIPQMVNLEVDDPNGKIDFSKDGKIMSNDARFKYTIRKCAINRTYLRDKRRVLLDVFRRDIQSELVFHNDPTKQGDAISTIVRKFIRDSQDIEQEFLAYRRYAINNSWLSDIVKSLN